MPTHPPDPPHGRPEPTRVPVPGAPGGTGSAGGLVEEQLEAMAAAWDRGERPRAEEFLARLPGLPDEDAVRIVFEEVCLRQEAGEASVTDEVFRRFPRWRSQLGVLLDCNRLLRAASEVQIPEAGDQLGDFRLLAEIGRGATGKAFLASQRSLADRPIVLKVTPVGQEEHLSLARLQHMNITPLYFEQVFPDRGLRVLGMPYLGGAPLDRILAALERVPVAERTGADLLGALDRCAPTLPTGFPPCGPFRHYLASESYVRAVCWLGACLADALQYAHDRGLVHLDVKPSNVLLAGDGQPMLLDFHLARGPIATGEPAPDGVGGTPGHLSPEQQALMAAVKRGGVATAAVDGRSDIYSLGLLLRETLVGSGSRIEAGESLERINPRVSPGLADVVRKCLAHDPRDRYPDAASLALDLRRHLNDLLLRGVSNRSLLERWRKWRRRSPGVLGRNLVRLAAALVIVAAVVYSIQRGRRIDAALDEGNRLLDQRQYAGAALALRRGLELAGRAPAYDHRVRRLTASLGRVRRAQAAADLHDLADRLRFRFGITPPEPDEARALYSRGLEVWKLRHRIVSPDGDLVDPGTGQQARADLVDLALILADLRTHAAARRDGDAQARADAEKILREAEAELGPSPTLSRDLRDLVGALGPTDPLRAVIPPPVTAWEHYELGRFSLRTNDYLRAEEELRRAVEMQPGAFWPHFYLGISAYRLGQYEEAVASFGTCIALAPRTPECYYNRALARQASGHFDGAIRDDSRALELNPRFSEAALNRGILRFRAGALIDALADFDLARATAAGPKALGLIEYNAALVHIARDDRPAARACLERAISHGVDEARLAYDRLRDR